MKMAVLWNFYLGTLVSFSTMNDSNPCHYVHTMMTTKMSQFFDQLSRVEYVDCVWGMNRYFKGYLHDKWFRVICSYTTFRCRMTPIMMMCIVQYCKVSYDTKIIFRANWGAVQILSRVLFAKGKIMIDWNGSRWSSRDLFPAKNFTREQPGDREALKSWKGTFCARGGSCLGPSQNSGSQA
jgi:hypothetical protein